jgi:PAS domain S-box-containing protein
MTLLGTTVSELDEDEGPDRQSAPVSSRRTSSHHRESGERLRKTYRALMNCAPDAIFVADSETGRILEANRAAAVLLDTSIDDIIGRHQSELHPSGEEDKYRAHFQHHKEAADTGPATLRTLEDNSQIYVETDDGRHVPVEINASFVHLKETTLLVGIFRDITERKQRERELKKAKAQAEEASRLKSNLLTNVSHEIRTPITSIIGFSKILTQMLKGEPADHAENIYQAGQHLMKTIHSILELSKLESGVGTLERRAVPLNQVAEWTVDLLDPQAEEKNISVEIQAADKPVKALANRDALNRIAENLLENAIKFTPEGGRVTIHVRAEDEALFEVEDTGIGMDPETTSELFEAFKQGSGGLDREYGGSGLGLSIVEKLVNLLGGEIDVTSSKGDGSRFTVRLPVYENQTDE